MIGTAFDDSLWLTFSEHFPRASSEKRIIRLHDLREDPWESKNLLASDLAEHKVALQKFQAVLDSLPDRDARPLYEPRAANPWDKKPRDMKRAKKRPARKR